MKLILLIGLLAVSLFGDYNADGDKEYYKGNYKKAVDFYLKSNNQNEPTDEQSELINKKTFENVSDIINNGSNIMKQDYPGGMPAGMSSGKDLKEIAEFIANGFKGNTPKSFTSCNACHGDKGQGMNYVSPAINDYRYKVMAQQLRKELTSNKLTIDYVREGLKEYDKGNYNKAKDFYEKGCDNGNLAGCLNIGFLFENHSTDSKTKILAADIYKKLCQTGYPKACNNLANMHDKGTIIKQDKQKAKEYYEKACKNGKGHLDACKSLGFVYVDGIVVKKDIKKAINLWEIACNGGNIDSCYNVAFNYYDGNGVKKNLQKAKNLWKKACNGGVSAGCKNYKILEKQGY